VSAIAPPTLELPLPPGALPMDALRSQVRRYRSGTCSAEQLIATVDRRGDQLEAEIDRRIARHHADFLRGVHRLEQLHSYMATSAAQARWLSRFPNGPASDPEPIACRLPSGHLVAVPMLLAPLHELELAPRQTANANGNGNSGGRAHDGRRGASE
jgi:hypothetical protein